MDAATSRYHRSVPSRKCCVRSDLRVEPRYETIMITHGFFGLTQGPEVKRTERMLGSENAKTVIERRYFVASCFFFILANRPSIPSLAMILPNWLR